MSLLEDVKVLAASQGDHLPKAPVLFGRAPNRSKENGGSWSWSYRPAGNLLSSEDQKEYARGAIVAIAVPPTLQGLEYAQLVSLLVPRGKQPISHPRSYP